MTGRTDYERFAEKAERRRLLRREELALEVTEAITDAMKRADVSRVELARRMGRTRGFVTQILAGGRNLTLGTLAEIAGALGCEVAVRVIPSRPASRGARYAAAMRR